MDGQPGQVSQTQAGPSVQPSPRPSQNGPSMQAQPSPRPPTTGGHLPAAASSSSQGEEEAKPRPVPPQQREPLLRIRVLAVEKKGKELNVRLDAATNLAPFRHSHYPPFLRSYRELTFFALSLSVHVPSQILAALPLPPPTFVASASPSPPQAEARVLCHSLARWFSRLTAEPAHRDHPETRNFIEADYSYHPIPPHVDYAPLLVQKRWRAVMDHAAVIERGISIDLGAGLGLPSGVLSTPATSGRSGGGGLFGFGGSKSSTSTVPGGKGLSLSRNVHDEDEDLVAARMEVTRLELQFSEAASKGYKVVESRAKVTDQLTALSNRLHTLAGVEDTRQLSSDMGLPRDLRTLADGLPAVDLTQQATSHTETMTLLYQLTYQSSNARAAKEALLARNALVEEHHEATKRTMLKKREIESLKARMGSGGVSRDRIEICIEEFGEASRYANALRIDLARLSKSMHGSLKNHSRNAHADLHAALVEHARGTVFHLKKDIQALKGLKLDIKRGVQGVPQSSQTVSQIPPSQSLTSTESVGDIIESQREPPSEVGDASFDAIAQSTEAGIDAHSTQPEGVLPQEGGGTDPTPGTATAAKPATDGDIPAGSSFESRQENTRPSEQHQTISSPSQSPQRLRPAMNNPWTRGSFEPSAQHQSPRVTAHEPSPASSPAWSRKETEPSMTQSLYHPSSASNVQEQQQQQQGGIQGGTMGGSGFLSRSDAGFGSARGGGPMGGSTMRGRGRISASEAARSLAGRF